MPISYRLVASGSGVVTTASGSIDRDEARRFWEEFLADPAPQAAQWELMDLRQLEGASLSAEGIQELVAIDKAHEAALEKLAFVATKPLSYGIARMYQGFAAELPYECRVFRELPEALEWLGVSPDIR